MRFWQYSLSAESASFRLFRRKTPLFGQTELAIAATFLKPETAILATIGAREVGLLATSAEVKAAILATSFARAVGYFRRFQGKKRSPADTKLRFWQFCLTFENALLATQAEVKVAILALCLARADGLFRQFPGRTPLAGRSEIAILETLSNARKCDFGNLWKNIGLTEQGFPPEVNFRKKGLSRGISQMESNDRNTSANLDLAPLKDNGEDIKFDARASLIEAIADGHIKKSTISTLMLIADALDGDDFTSLVWGGMIQTLVKTAPADWIPLLKLFSDYERRTSGEHEFGKLVRTMLEIEQKDYGRVYDYLNELKTQSFRTSMDPRMYAAQNFPTRN